MNQPPPGPPPPGYGGFPPPPGQPPFPPGWHPQPGQQPGRQPGPPPRRSRTGLTIALLAGGLVLVLAAIGITWLLVNEDGSGDDDGDGGGASSAAREEACDVYADVLLDSEIWAASELDPDKLQEVYDAVLADISDDELATLVEAEAEATVSYYAALAAWEQETLDAVSRGEYPDTTIPSEITDQQGEVTRTQGAVIEACAGSLPDRGDGPAPSITAPPLETPGWMEEQ